MATAFNDKHLKSIHSQSHLSQNHGSAGSPRSRSGMPKNKLVNNERLNTHSSFHDSERRHRRPSNEGNLSFNDDYLRKKPREPFVGGPIDSAKSASRRSSVEKDVNGIISKPDSQKSTMRGYMPLPKHPAEVKVPNPSELAPVKEVSVQQIQIGDGGLIKNAGKTAAERLEDGRMVEKGDNPLQKDQSKFTNHEWPENKAYVDVTKLKSEHIAINSDN